MITRSILFCGFLVVAGVVGLFRGQLSRMGDLTIGPTAYVTSALIILVGCCGLAAEWWRIKNHNARIETDRKKKKRRAGK